MCTSTPEGFVKTYISVSYSQSVWLSILGLGLVTCISNKFQELLMLLVRGPHFEKYWSTAPSLTRCYVREKLVWDVVSGLGEPAFDLGSAFYIKVVLHMCEALQPRCQMSLWEVQNREKYPVGSSFYRPIMVIWAEGLRINEWHIPVGKHLISRCGGRNITRQFQWVACS